MSIKQVAVCGAGLMGSGIAQAVAQAGYFVILEDLEAGIVDRAVAKIGGRLQSQVEKGRLSSEEREAILGRIRTTTRLEDFGDADLVIEAVVEDVAVKRSTFAELDRICRPSALLVTNTSTLSPTEIGAATRRPEQTAGLHFFNPAPVMKLVEVIPGLATSQETVSALREFVSSLGKTPIVVKESPGGIVTRILLLVRNEAVNILAEGIASAEDIDTAMKLGAGWPMGPLALTDLVGIDLTVTNSDSLCRELGTNRFRPHPLLRKMVRAGYLGQKSGRGFYVYDQGERKER